MSPTQAIERKRQVIRRQHKALSTEATYAYWLRRYIRALQEIPDDLPSEKKLERFLTDIAIRDDVAAATQNQAFNGAQAVCTVTVVIIDMLSTRADGSPARVKVPPAHVRPKHSSQWLSRIQGQDRSVKPI